MLGAMIAVWVGRAQTAILSVLAVLHLWPPPPPPPLSVVEASMVMIVAMVPLTIGEFIAAYLRVLSEIRVTNTHQALLEIDLVKKAFFNLLGDLTSVVTRVRSIIGRRK